MEVFKDGEKIMRAMVTGAGGWLGRTLLDKLSSAGYKMVCVDFWPGSIPHPLRSRKNLAFVKGDIRSPESFLDDMKGCDAVFNCAGMQHPKRTSELYKINAHAPGKILQCCQKAKVRRFIHVSSSSVYGSNRAGQPFTEKSPFAPLTHYAISKAQGDLSLLKSGKSSSTDIIILRPGVFYGTSPSPNMASLVGMVKKRRIVLFGKRGFLRTYVDISKVADALLAAHEHGKRNEAYLIGDENPMDTLSLYESVAAPLNVRLAPLRLPVALSRLCEKAALLGGYLNIHLKYPNIAGEFGRDHFFSCEKAKKQLYYTPHPSSAEGLRLMAAAVAAAAKCA